MARTLTLGLAHDLRIDAPYSGSSKAQVVARGIELGVPFELTLSCMSPGIGKRESEVESEVPNPASPRHCGLCSKCRERHDAFIELGVADPTEYEDQRYVRA